MFGLHRLLETMPVDFESIFSVCRTDGAKKGFRRWLELYGDKKKMAAWKKVERERVKKVRQKMMYFQRL
jgi:hypothetical protein